MTDSVMAGTWSEPVAISSIQYHSITLVSVLQVVISVCRHTLLVVAIYCLLYVYMYHLTMHASLLLDARWLMPRP